MNVLPSCAGQSTSRPCKDNVSEEARQRTLTNVNDMGVGLSCTRKQRDTRKMHDTVYSKDSDIRDSDSYDVTKR